MKIDGIDERQIEEKLEQLLPSYMVPQVIKMTNIPLLVNGKVDRQFLLRQYEENVKEGRVLNVYTRTGPWMRVPTNY